MFNRPATSTTNKSKDDSSSVKRFTLPVFNRSTTTARNSNLASNLATAGLFSALAACGGDGASNSSPDNNNPPDDDNTPDDGNPPPAAVALNFKAFVEPASPVDGVNYIDSDSGDDTSVIYVKTGFDSVDDWGSLTVSVTGEGTPEYEVTGITGYRFYDGKTFDDYFAIDGAGKLQLKSGQVLAVGGSSEGTANQLTVTVSASVGEESSSHEITIHLGEHFIRTEGGFVSGGAGDDYFQGSTLSDNFIANAGDDIIYGNAGNDELFGYAGDDTIYGGTGNDTLDGGANADRFVFSKASGVDNGSDIIKDFTRADGDKIVIEDAGTLDFGGLDITYANNTATIKGHGDSDDQITLEEHGLISWDATSNALTAGDFDFIA